VTHPEDVYTWLLRCLIQEATLSRKGAESGTAAPDLALDDVLHHGLMLIARKWDRMNAAAVLDCLPDDLLLRDMSTCLAAMSIGMMRRSHSHTLQVRRGLVLQFSSGVGSTQRIRMVLNPRAIPSHAWGLDHANKRKNACCCLTC
jgi:hypothetical protein